MTDEDGPTGVDITVAFRPNPNDDELGGVGGIFLGGLVMVFFVFSICLLRPSGCFFRERKGT